MRPRKGSRRSKRGKGKKPVRRALNPRQRLRAAKRAGERAREADKRMVETLLADSKASKQRLVKARSEGKSKLAKVRASVSSRLSMIRTRASVNRSAQRARSKALLRNANRRFKARLMTLKVANAGRVELVKERLLAQQGRQYKRFDARLQRALKAQARRLGMRFNAVLRAIKKLENLKTSTTRGATGE